MKSFLSWLKWFMYDRLVCKHEWGDPFLIDCGTGKAAICKKCKQWKRIV